MKKLPFFLILFLTSSFIYAQTAILPNDTNIQYSGRVEFSDPLHPRFSMPSSSIKVKFSGTLLKGTFSGKNFDGNGLSYLYVIVDGKADPKNREIVEVQQDEKEYVLVEGLENKEHIIELVKVNEYWGMIEFHGFTTDGSGATKLPSKKTRRIEFYGDSNPAGWSAWNDKDQGGDGESGGYFTYPGFVSRALNADLVNFSAGGHGITPKVGNLDLTLSFDKIHINTDNQETNTWDFANNYLGGEPNVVVINLGANDYWAGATRQQQEIGWRKMVNDLIRPVYPNTHIVLANSEGWAIGEPTDYIEEMVEKFHQSGEKNISYVKFPWLWGQDHAVISEQAGFADILSHHIAKQMNWETPKETHYSSFPKEGELLGNRSFENAILSERPDGWRPSSIQSNAKVVSLENEARTGINYVLCPKGSGVHQAVKSSQGDKYIISVWVKGIGGEAEIGYEFRDQGQRTITTDTYKISTNDEWQQINIETNKAPLNTWQINVILKSNASEVLFDDVDMKYDDVTSINRQVEGLGWMIYPNPSQNVVHIQSSDQQKINYSIYSQIGQKVYAGSDSDVDITLWENGVYFVKREGAFDTKKLIKN